MSKMMNSLLFVAVLIALPASSVGIRTVTGSIIGFVEDQPDAGMTFEVGGDIAHEFFQILARENHRITEGDITLIEGPDFSCFEIVDPEDETKEYRCRFYIDADGTVVFIPPHMIGGSN